jgi:single-strand DNA-binding protein
MYHSTEIIGRLGRDPEHKFLQSGTEVCNASVAVSESWKDKQSGEKREKTTWYRLSWYGKSAEHASTLLRKGMLVFAVGTVESRAYMGDDGEPRSTLELRVGTWKKLEKSDSAARNGAASDYDEYSDFDDKDIPF